MSKIKDMKRLKAYVDKHPVEVALRHVNSVFPNVTQVFYGIDGRWLYFDENLECPDFEDGNIDVSLLEEAANAAYEDKGFPCSYRLE